MQLKYNEEVTYSTAKNPKILVDGVFFQLYKTGIARVWKSLLEEWVNNGFAKHIILLDRAGTAPKIPGVRYRLIPSYDYNATDADREILQQVCDEEGADLFISSYYTTPNRTPSVFMAYDMIPEIMGWDMNNPMWQVKHQGIQNASSYLAISENTARDLVRFFPEIPLESVKVALCGVTDNFSPASQQEVNSFKTKYGISKPYFMIVSIGGYKNTILFLEAFARLDSKQAFDIVCTGAGGLLDEQLRVYTSGSTVHMLQLSDEELKTAYSGAVALVYPSKYEGFGLPVLEAIACGCPVITCPNASIPEVAGKAALYVQDDDIEEMANALCEVQKPSVRKSLITAGLEQAKKFSWANMAKVVSSTLIDTTLLPLNLKQINLIVFPDWSHPEESLGLELQRVISAIATHPDSKQITLLIDTSGIYSEDAKLLLSGVTMNLLMEEDLDITEGLEIYLVSNLADIQWEALLSRIQARIVLSAENKQAIAQNKAENVPSYDLDYFNSLTTSVL
jgi:glycosyltransferase involved in cell wall biosynthesis